MRAEIGPVDGVCSLRLPQLTLRGPAQAAGGGGARHGQLRAAPSSSELGLPGWGRS